MQSQSDSGEFTLSLGILYPSHYEVIRGKDLLIK